VGGLIDDFYRGIVRIGGIPNHGFPIDWWNNNYRLDGVFGSGAAARAARGLDQAAYDQIAASRPPRDLVQEMLWLGLHQPLDGPRWQEQSLGYHAPRIRAPILITHAWQDEQTGPTGWQLFNRVPDDVPKRLLLTNGHHGVQPDAAAAFTSWFDHWLLDKSRDEIADPQRRVACYFETPRPDRRGHSANSGPAPTAPLVAADFPLPRTRWTRYHLRSGNRLSTAPAASDEAAASYRVLHSGTDPKGSRAHYLLPFAEPTAICGPAVLTLWATLTTIDTDFYVLLADRAPDGRLFGLQRGLLRASHRAMDPDRSDYVHHDGRDLLIRPHHRHEQAEPVRPHEPHEFQIELHAVGHVFRPGHQLALFISQPPAGDPIGVTPSGAPSYRYQSQSPPGTVTILHGAEHPSSLLLPVLPELPPVPNDPVPLDRQAGLQPAG
jgi:predicted acyl esterase